MTVKRARLVFAVLMQAAREGKHLTQYDKQQLSVARQVLRQNRKPIMNNSLKLVYEESGREVKIGDIVTTFRGDKGQIVQIEKPRHGGSTGRVGVRMSDGFVSSFFPSVVGAHWIGRTDQGTNPRKPTQSIKAEHADVFIHNPKKGVLIYGQVNRIIATKVQKHICDAECKRHGHRYYHDFSSKPKMYGLPNGDILISSR